MTRDRFISLVSAEQEGLRKFLLALCRGNEADADDLCQETLLKAYLSYDGFVERFKFSTWLYKIAYNTFVDFSRKTQHEVTASECLADHAAEGIAEIADDSSGDYRYEPLYRALDGLPINEQTAFLLFYMEDKSILDIARIIRKPMGTIKSYLSRGRVHLKNVLQTDGRTT